MSKRNIYLRFMWWSITRDGRSAALKKASYLKEHFIFSEMGENCYYHPRLLPTHPELISFGSNVTICADVKFFEHDRDLYEKRLAYTNDCE